MEKYKGVGVNPELRVVLIITIILLLGGFVAVNFGDLTLFNFYSSKITVNGANIQEELHFIPDKDYHTLFRNFVSSIYWINSSESMINSVIINNIQCSDGDEYVRDYYGSCYTLSGSSECAPYTENNEYGCSYGDTLGFLKGKEYTVNAEYEIHPENLFKINNVYYIKFVAYSPKNHVRLTSKNFVVYGDVIMDKKYSSDENVILYISYSGDRTDFKIIEQKDFEFDSGIKSLLRYIIVFFPGIIFFLIWFIYGRENTYEETPKELSTFPNKRKFWEVSAYFNPPFFRIDKNLFASVLLNFYNKKIIDIKEKGKDMYIKLNKFEGDKIEKEIYDILEFIQLNLRKDKDKDLIDGDYFNIKKFMKSFYYSQVVGPLLLDRFKELKEDVKEEGKQYIRDDNLFRGMFFFLFLLVFFLGFTLMNPFIIGLYVLTIIVIIVLLTGAIFSRFKGEYYIEYQRWRAFKRYLKNSFSITSATHKTVVIWNEYLVYATALGVSDRVIKELRAYNIISEKQMNLYNGLIISTSSGFSGVSATSAGGGFGGAGGGGVGGGGGGGR